MFHHVGFYNKAALHVQIVARNPNPDAGEDSCQLEISNATTSYGGGKEISEKCEVG